MARDNPVSRRNALKLTGAAASTALIAGCSGGDDEGNGNGNGNGNGDSSDGIEIESGADIRFSGQTSEWTGLQPSSIEDESNPTLILTEGEDYTIGWTEGDGARHNIEIHNSDGSVVDDLSTDEVSEPGDGQILEFTASSEMAQYVCSPHSSSMVGDIQVE